MARSEFKLAYKLRPQKVSDFKTLDLMRKFLIKVFNDSRREKQLGIMTDFSKQKFEFDSSYTKIGSDSLGGKGRGIAFIRTLLYRSGIDIKYKNLYQFLKFVCVYFFYLVLTFIFCRLLKNNSLYFPA